MQQTNTINILEPPSCIIALQTTLLASDAGDPSAAIAGRPLSALIYLGIALILLLVCSALISGSETAFFSLTPKQLDALEEKDDSTSNRILQLLKKPNYLLGTILQLNNFVNILIVLITGVLLKSLVDLHDSPVLQFIVNTVVVTFIIVLFGEVMPKLIANHTPVKFAGFMSKPLWLLRYLTYPFSRIMEKITIKVENSMPKEDVTLEDLSKAVEIAGPASGQEKKMLKGIVKLPVTSVKKIMKPRVEVAYVDMEMSNREVIERATQCGFSRLPVCREDLDDIRGFVYIKDLMPFLLPENSTYDWKKHIREVYFVPESKKINDLLEEFRQKRIHMAVVVDEYGGTDGIVTLEDILEEIVGEIVDESDKEAPQQQQQQQQKA